MAAPAMIVNAGLARVVYASPYPDPLAEQLLRDAAIDLARFPDETVMQRG